MRESGASDNRHTSFSRVPVQATRMRLRPIILASTYHSCSPNAFFSKCVPEEGKYVVDIDKDIKIEDWLQGSKPAGRDGSMRVCFRIAKQTPGLPSQATAMFCTRSFQARCKLTPERPRACFSGLCFLAGGSFGAADESGEDAR